MTNPTTTTTEDEREPYTCDACGLQALYFTTGDTALRCAMCGAFDANYDHDPHEGDYCPDCHRIHTSDAMDELCSEEKSERRTVANGDCSGESSCTCVACLLTIELER
jgi:hypothetical protein